MRFKLPSQNFKILVTGGAGFIGGALVEKLFLNNNCEIYSLDKYGYASDKERLIKLINENPLKKDNLINIKADLTNQSVISEYINKIKPNLIFHLAAESHVDRSISSPRIFFENNVFGTLNLVEASYYYWKNLNPKGKSTFKFIHISTDEVFGSLGSKGQFNEYSQINPRSPYSASKASSDHILNAWFHTYQFPGIITNCSNNFGPWQFPEKLIPNVILKCLNNEKISVYGNGENIRDWLYVDDHISALINVAINGKIGEKYCIGGNTERKNIEVVEKICSILDKKLQQNRSYTDLITFVKDRPGHDQRYSINNNKIKTLLNWEPEVKFESGLEKTIDWYINNQIWIRKIQCK